MHGIYLRDDVSQLGIELPPLACLNSVTLLGAEAVGRSYGGGMLKLEPKEADLLPVPSPELVDRTTGELLSLVSPVTALLANGSVREAVRLVDDMLLRQGCEMGDGPISAIEAAREHMVGRRKARARSSKGS